MLYKYIESESRPTFLIDMIMICWYEW